MQPAREVAQVGQAGAQLVERLERPARGSPRAGRGGGEPDAAGRSATVTSRCWAPSWRLRSISRRARSAASRMRAREARTSASCASMTSCSRSACSASRRAVMSKIAPSSQRRPSPASLRLAALEHPADRSRRGARCRYSSANGRPVATESMTRSRDVLAVVGVLDARERAHGVVDEVARRVADDLLDLVAQPLHRPVAVARAAVDRARDVVDERAQQRLVGPQPRGAQPGRHPRGEHLGLERDAHDVVGAGVERLAQLMRASRGRRSTHDVRRRPDRAARGRPRSARPLPRRRRSRPGAAGVDQRDRRGALGDAQQLEAGVREHRGRPSAETSSSPRSSTVSPSRTSPSSGLERCRSKRSRPRAGRRTVVLRGLAMTPPTVHVGREDQP